MDDPVFTEEKLDEVASSYTGSCGYFPGRFTSKKIITSYYPTNAGFDSLMILGYRRFKDYFYRAECPHCRQCMSYRVPVADFRPSKNMKRVLRRNRDLTFRWERPKLTLSKARLYLKYQMTQHSASWESKKLTSYIRQTLQVMLDQMYSPIMQTLELTVSLQERLVGFAVFDCGNEALSAVYSVYDTDLGERSLGTVIILEAIRYAHQQGIRYVYLGYYIPESKKMNYKNRFRPAQIRNPFTGSWLDADEAISQINFTMNAFKPLMPDSEK